MKCQIWLPVERKLFSCIETTVISLEYYLQIFIWGWVIQSHSIRVATLSHWQNDQYIQYQLMDTVPLLRFLLFPPSDFQSLPTNEFPPNGSITNSFCSHFWFEMCLGDNHRFYELITNIYQPSQHPALVFWLEYPQVQQTWGLGHQAGPTEVVTLGVVENLINLDVLPTFTHLN